MKKLILATLLAASVSAPIMGMDKLKTFYKNNRTASLALGAGFIALSAYGMREVYLQNCCNSEKDKLNKKVTKLLNNNKNNSDFFCYLNTSKIIPLFAKHTIPNCCTTDAVSEVTKYTLNMSNLINAIKTTNYGIFTSYNSELIEDLWNIFDAELGS